MKLKKPITFGEKTITELTPCFDLLNGGAQLDAEGRLRHKLSLQGESLVMPETDSRYYAELAVVAYGVPIDVIRQLGPTDFRMVINEVRDFLFGNDSDDVPTSAE